MPWQSATLLLGVFALAAAAVILSVRGLPGRDTQPEPAAAAEESPRPNGERPAAAGFRFCCRSR